MFKNPVLDSLKMYCVSILEISGLMLFRNIIIFNSENPKKSTNILPRQNVEFLNIKAADTTLL
jgi:hypothetical protein